MVISFDNLLKILPRFASIAPLKRLTFDHLLCPAIGVRSYLKLKTCEQYSPRERNDLRGEKFTAPINRTKTYFVNRGSQEEPPLTPAEVTQRNVASKLLDHLPFCTV